MIPAQERAFAERHHRRRMLRFMVTYCSVVAVVLGALVWGISFDAQRTAACEAHGWERADARGGLCVDGDGVVREP